MQPVHVFPGTLFVIACVVNVVVFFCHVPSFPSVPDWHIAGWTFGNKLSQTKFGTWLMKSHLPLGSVVIKLTCDSMRKRYAKSWARFAAETLRRENIATLSEDEQEQLTSLVEKALAPTEHFMGRKIAFVEEVLYMYSAFAQIESIFSGVLLFKAFYTWISGEPVQILQPPTPPTYSDAVKAQFERFCQSRSHMLVKFYEYAIGNFVSLGIALLCYLLVTKFSYHCPLISNWTSFFEWFQGAIVCKLDPGK
jgi:hypothetical protein